MSWLCMTIGSVVVRARESAATAAGNYVKACDTQAGDGREKGRWE